MEWALVVDEMHADGTLLAHTLGGGQQLTFNPIQVEEHDFVRVPERMIENPSWRHTTFHAEWLERDYQGWTTGRRWNGWALPFFEFEEALRYATDSQQYGNATVYDATRDVFITSTPGGEAEVVIDEPVVVKIRGRGEMKLYPIGTGSWTWLEKSDIEDAT